jgi:NADH dehydrogenase
MRIVGFGGVATVRQLERVLRRHKDVEITLVSRENFFVLTPLLFVACSGRLELRHCAQPIRAALRYARFFEATVESVDLKRQLVRAVTPDAVYTNCRTTIWWSRSARRRRWTDSRLAEGADLQDDGRRAAAEKSSERVFRTRGRRARTRRSGAAARVSTIVVIGGGLVGTELVGELTAFADDVLRFYPRIKTR